MANLSPLHYFEENLSKSPEKCAVSDGLRSLSYRQIDVETRKFAAMLQSAGCRSGDLIGVHIDRSIEMVIATLSVLRMGCAYCPLDTSYPIDRLSIMIEQLPNMKVVISAENTYQAISEIIPSRIANIQFGLPDSHDTAPIPDVDFPDIDPESMCYVVFTSGSTGIPKAVSVRHSGWGNLLGWIKDRFAHDSADSNLLISSAGFDISQRSLMMPFVSGATLFVLPSKSFDPVMATRMIQENGVQTLHCAPSTLYMLIDAAGFSQDNPLRSVRHVYVGGEPLSPRRVLRWAETDGAGCTLVNVYGVAECTDVATFYALHDYERYAVEGCPIGKAIANTRIYLVDGDNTDADEGEIYITGACVGAGYANDSERTAQAFVELETPGGMTRAYRTGDLARRRADGELMYIGRVDNQLKVRGTRIDVGEVEAALLTIEGVENAVVVGCAPTLSQQKELVAFVQIPAENADDILATCLAKCRRQMVSQAVPSVFAPVQSYPLTPNGKIDRKALASMPLETLKSQGHAAHGSTAPERELSLAGKH